MDGSAFKDLGSFFFWGAVVILLIGAAIGVGLFFLISLIL